MSSKVDNYWLAIEQNLKKQPRLNFQNFRLRVIGLASQMCNDITGPTGLLGFLLTLLPPNGQQFLEYLLQIMQGSFILSQVSIS